jgi:hypothetical protein
MVSSGTGLEAIDKRDPEIVAPRGRADLEAASGSLRPENVAPREGLAAKGA